jgi:hypothetical protein
MLNPEGRRNSLCAVAARGILRTLAQAILALGLVVVSIGTDAQVLWYGGDIDASSPLSNNTETLDRSSVSYVLTNFVVPDNERWRVTALFSNNLPSRPSAVAPFTQARWSIRKGVATGNFGTVLFSGVGPATQKFTGRTFPFWDPEINVTVSGLSLELGPGSYYLAVSPVTATAPLYMVASHVSVNRIGTPGLGGTFQESHTPMAGGPIHTIVNVDSGNASIGVIGAAIYAVPLLSDLPQIALLCGLLMLAGWLAFHIRPNPAFNRPRWPWLQFGARRRGGSDN